MILDWMDSHVQQAQEKILLELKSNISNSQLPVRIWLDHPSNLYLLHQQSDIYLRLMQDNDYRRAFHEPVRSLFHSHINKILDGLHQPIDIIDLGPGYPDKSFPLLEYLSVNKMKGIYIPVDICLHFLNVAENAVRDFNVPVSPIHCLFEELPGILHNLDQNSRLIILGLTFMNYRPETIIPLLCSMATDKDVIVIATELVSDQKKEDLIAPYHTYHAKMLNSSIIELLNIPFEKVRYKAEMPLNRIEMGFEVLDDIIINNTFKLKKGTTIVTAISYRYTIDDLDKELSSHFTKVEILTNSHETTAIAKCSFPIK